MRGEVAAAAEAAEKAAAAAEEAASAGSFEPVGAGYVTQGSFGKSVGRGVIFKFASYSVAQIDVRRV